MRNNRVHYGNNWHDVKQEIGGVKMKDIFKLVIAYYVVKHFVLDNNLLDKLRGKIKDGIEEII